MIEARTLNQIRYLPSSLHTYSNIVVLKYVLIIYIITYLQLSILYLLSVSKVMAAIKEMDQNSWVCYKFGQNSYYYGQVGLLDLSGVVHSKDNAQLAADPKVKLVKHGFGIFIYQDPTGNSRYQGYWAKDHKNGKGILKMKDGSEYEGQFKDGFYHDSGILKWASGDVYDGRWKKGRMDGPGLFKRANGTSLKGSFKNNYLIDFGNVLRNPFIPDQQYEDLKKRRKQINKQYQKNEKVKNGYFQRVKIEDNKKIFGLVEKSTKNNRVALIVSSQESAVKFNSVTDWIKKQGNQTFEIDLRKNFKLQGEEKYNYLKQVENSTQNCLKEGGVLILTLDDSESIPQFQELFYPDVKQLYSTNGFNSLIWSPRDLKKPQIRSKLIGNNQISEKFYFTIWSKIKLSQTLSNDFIMEKLQKRLESIIPFIKIDIIYIENGKRLENQQQIFN